MLKLFGWLGIALGIASTFLLIKQGFALGLAAPLALMFDWYQAVVEAFRSVVGPVVEATVSLVNDLFAWKLRLYPYWPHAVLAWLGMASAFARVTPSLALSSALLLGAFVVGLWTASYPTNVTDIEHWTGAHVEPGVVWVGTLGLVMLLFGSVFLVASKVLGDPFHWTLGISLLAVPVGVLLLIVSNAGLRLIPGM